MAIISFFVLAYNLLIVKDITNKESVEELNSKLDAFLSHIDKKFEEIQSTRIAICNVNLRKSPNKKAQKVGLIKSGQRVIVLNTNHKWIYISYFEKENS